MRTHVQRTVYRCFAVLRQLRSIRHSVPTSTLQTLTVSLVVSRLDYGNAVLWLVSSTPLQSARVSHKRRSTAHLQTTFLGPHLRCSSQPPLASVARESDGQGCCGDVQSHTWISTNIPEATGSCRRPIPGRRSLRSARSNRQLVLLRVCICMC